MPGDNTPWTARDEKIVRTQSAKKSAKATGRTLAAIYQRRKRLLTAPHVSRRWTPDEDAMVRQLPAREAAQATNRTLASVQMRRFVLGIKGANVQQTPNPTDLIGGPYLPPRVRVGDRVTCLYRHGDVVVTCISDARIPWPRCRKCESGGSGSGLFVDETMVRAIRTEPRRR